MKLKIDDTLYVNKSRFNTTGCCLYLQRKHEIDTSLWLNTLTIYIR
jgi:hypothetical protein